MSDILSGDPVHVGETWVSEGFETTLWVQIWFFEIGPQGQIYRSGIVLKIESDCFFECDVGDGVTQGIFENAVILKD